MAGVPCAVDISVEFPDYYKSLSQRLCKVLDDIGASTEVRDLRSKSMTSSEINLTFINSHSVEIENMLLGSRNSTGTHGFNGLSFYRFGSSIEGTTIPGLNSDVDTVCALEMYPVLTDISDIRHDGECLLMVQDSNTPPGYTKLQIVFDGEPQFLPELPFENDCFYIDKEYRLVFSLKHDIAIPGRVMHGPAYTKDISEKILVCDLVYAYRCRKVPDCSHEWFSRRRQYNWPTADMIEKCKTYGCLLVQVGHPNSNENHLEWRLSFSLQERLLVTQFNSAQLKCYILLKVIKKEIVRIAVKEESLTSYHCKTCMLYMIENTPTEFWREDNLLNCLYASLNLILMWVEIGVCPNYFIPEENMFDGRITRDIQIKLREVLRRLISADGKFILQLKTDDIGDRFQNAIVFGIQINRNQQNLPFYHFSNLDQVHNRLHERNKMFLLCRTEESSISDTCKRLYRLKLSLKSTETITEHTREQTRNALSRLYPCVEVGFISVLSVLAHYLNKSKDYIFKILTSETWNNASLEFDAFYFKLKQASLLYMEKFYKVSLDILLNLEGRLQQQLSLCNCSLGHAMTTDQTELLNNERISLSEEKFYAHFVPCIVYLPAEKDLTPAALCYEMNRSDGFSFDGREDWFELAVVDGKILLYFLLYMNHHRLNMEANAASDIENIKWLIETDKLLGHRETALNILGWIYADRGLVDKAVECFQKSFAIQPTHNAAFWHKREIQNA